MKVCGQLISIISILYNYLFISFIYYYYNILLHSFYYIIIFYIIFLYLFYYNSIESYHPLRVPPDNWEV